MKKRFYLLLPIYLGFFVVLGVYEVYNPPFSTDSAHIGNYEVQIGTSPPVPEVGKDTQIHFHVLDENGNQVDKFRMGILIYHNYDLVKSIPLDDHYQGSWDLDYVFEESGNHVIRVDLVDLKNGGMLTYAFNVAVLNFVGTMFSYLIIAGIAGAVGILLAIAIFQRRVGARNKQE